MSDRVRIHELAKQLETESAEVLTACRKLNIRAKNALSSIAGDDAERVRRQVSTPKGTVVSFDDRTGRGVIELDTDHRFVKFDLRETKLGNEKFTYLQQDHAVELELGDDDSVSQINVL